MEPDETVPVTNFWLDPPDILTSKEPNPSLIQGIAVIVPSDNSRGPPEGSVMTIFWAIVTELHWSAEESFIIMS